ncbi:MAG: polysaccharide deacetylase family protein [Flavobacteriales bacterium]|nr:polysaccharide deacetylase family protein [Flavobacteriales bacterium]
MYLVKTPEIIKPFAGDLVWNKSREEKKIYLTFDDGPTEKITFEILDLLEGLGAKATFFCIGGNVLKYPDAYKAILEAGHQTANHTWNHMNGWEFSDYSYFKNVLECSRVVDSRLFRPPYGRITQSQAKALKKRYDIIMWDVLSADWRSDVTPEKCLSNVRNNATAGSIIVFHDSEKAYANMIYALPRFIEYSLEGGYAFEVLEKLT